MINFSCHRRSGRALQRLCWLSTWAVLLCSDSSLQAGEKQSLFNGRDLQGWDGDRNVWSVQDRQIVGSTVDHQIGANTFLVWQGGEVADFRLVYKARLEGDNNSGVQYRSQLTDPQTWRVIGYQADMHAKPEYTAMLYSEGTGRSIIAERGEKVIIGAETIRSALADQPSPLTPIDLTKWHEYTILAQGNRLIHQVDGNVTVDVTDNHEKRCERGIIALQVHAGAPMAVYFKDLELESLTAKGE